MSTEFKHTQKEDDVARFRVWCGKPLSTNGMRDNNRNHHSALA